MEGPNAMLEHKLSADTFLDCNFDTKAIVVFRRLVPNSLPTYPTNLAALPQTPSLCFTFLRLQNDSQFPPVAMQ